MKKKDRVKLSNRELNTGSSFWKKRGIGYRSVGTITGISHPGLENRLTAVKWDNGAESICHIGYLELFEENISLPNLKFKREKA